MTTTERTQMLERYRTANVWLSRVYDPQRSDEHRLALWQFLMSTAKPKLKQILENTRLIDESAVEFWDNQGKN